MISDLKNKFALLRKEPEFSALSEMEWIAFQIDYITKILGHRDLQCIEMGNYYKKVIQQCIGNDEIDKHFVSNTITCFDKNGKMYTIYVYTPNDGNRRIMYLLNANEGIRPTTQDEINEMLQKGLRILSRKRSKEYLGILSNDPTREQDKNIRSIRDMASLPEVMARFREAYTAFEAFTKFTERNGRDWADE